MTNIPALAHAMRGTTSNGVPFIALPPEDGVEPKGLIIAWHGGDPPRSEEALAGALPMRDVPAWRVYLGLPLFGPRMPEGGMDEIGRRATEDSLTLLYHPIIEGAADELPEAVDDLRSRLGIDAALPLGLFGFSMGGAAALLAAARHALPCKAVVTFGAVVDASVLIDHVSSLFGSTYEWTDDRRRLAEEISIAHRAGDLVQSSASVLMGIGEEDPFPFHQTTEEMAAAIQAEGGTAELRTLADVAHGFVDEPGDIAMPQAPQARAVDEMASAWFQRHLT